MHRFHWADYLVLALFLTVYASVGFFVGWRDRRKMTARHFFTASGQMHWIPVALSMQSSFLSAIYILSTPIEIYHHGTMYYYLVLANFVALPLASHLCLSLFYKLKLISVYHYLEVRFNSTVKTAGAATFMAMLLLYMSVVLFTPASALSQVTGLSLNISILLCGSICVFYTLIGGIKATIWVDFIQMLVVITGLVAILVRGSMMVGGFQEVWRINWEGGRIIFNDFRPDPTLHSTFWTQFVGGIFLNFSLYVSSQNIIQKFLSVRSLKDAQKSIYLDVLTNVTFFTLVCMLGLLAYAHFHHCDPILSGSVKNRNQIVPFLVLEVLRDLPGLPGLFMSVTFSAALSTLSGGLNSLTAISMSDFVVPLLKWKKMELKERTKSIVTRIIVLLFGAFCVGSGYWAQYMGPSVLRVSLGIFGFIGGPLTAVICLGMFLPFVNSYGAFLGLVSSLCVLTWIAVGGILFKSPKTPLHLSTQNCPNVTQAFLYEATNNLLKTDTLVDADENVGVLWVYKISIFYYGLLAIVVAVLVAVPVSLITGRAKDVDRRLIVNWSESFSCADEGEEILEGDIGTNPKVEAAFEMEAIAEENAAVEVEAAVEVANDDVFHPSSPNSYENPSFIKI